MFLNALILACCGAVFSLAFPPIGLWFLCLALIPLFVLIAQSNNSRAAFWYGFAFALGFFALHILWLPQSFANSFGNFFWATYPPMLLVLAVMWGIVTGLSRLLGGRGGISLALLPALWLMMEWARSQGIFAFPWGQLGYIWLPTPLAQLADLQGVYGLSFFTAAITALLAVPFVPAPQARDYGFSNKSKGINWFPFITVAVILVVAFAYSSQRVQQVAQWLTPDKRALLVQGNTDPFGRVQALTEDFEVYNDLTRAATETRDTPVDMPVDTPVDVVIWPEGAILEPSLEGEAGQEARAFIQENAQGALVITGAERANPASLGVALSYEERLLLPDYNSVFSLSEGQIVDSYDKVVLVPFGEVYPFYKNLAPIYNFVFRQLGLPPQAGRAEGETIHALQSPLAKAAVYICYESIFPNIARTMVADGAEVLVNISNDAWFSHGNGAAQHFAMGAMRAIETRRYLLRVGNDGITALVNPLGQVEERLERGVADTLEVNFALLEQESIYVRYGDIWLMVLLGYTALIAVVGLFRRDSGGI